MIKLIKKVFIFLSPFLLFTLVIYFIDPYDYFHKSNQNDLKKNIAYLSDYGRRSNLIAYKNHPQPNVILGYSQANKIKLENVPEADWCKLTYGGADTWEAIESFNVVLKNPQLKKIIIDINSFNYMQACSRVYNSISSRSYKPIRMLANPLYYFYDKEVVRTALTYLKSALLNDSSYLLRGKPAVDNEEFWNHQMKTGHNIFSGNYNISRRELMHSLKEIKSYCDDNGIEILVFSSLMHTDLQEVARDFKVKVFLPDMVAIFGEIRDFAYPNDYTRDKQNFADPFHAVSDSVYINTFWKRDTTYCRVVSRANIRELTKNQN